jgi:hypothetical protein
MAQKSQIFKTQSILLVQCCELVTDNAQNEQNKVALALLTKYKMGVQGLPYLTPHPKQVVYVQHFDFILPIKLSV